MKTRSLRTPLVILGLVVTTMAVLRAADDKGKAKEGEMPSSGTVKFASVPAAVQKTYKDESKNAKIELLGKGINNDKSTYYNAIIPIGTNDYQVVVGEDGQLLEKLLQPVHNEDLKLEDCPQAVQKALREESKTAKVEAIHRITAGKRSDFIIDVTVQKSMYQITFTEDGTLMSKVIDYGDATQDQSAETQKASDKPELNDKPEKSAKKQK